VELDNNWDMGGNSGSMLFASVWRLTYPLAN
jgi:hypothetical protein